MNSKNLESEVKRSDGKTGMLEPSKDNSGWSIHYFGEKVRLKKLRELEIEREKGFEYAYSKFVNADYVNK